MASVPTTFSDIRFWDFSLALYVRPGVAECCLALQDEHAANVNLMLWALWLEQRGILLTFERLIEAEARVQQWDTDYVQVLRQLRRTMKNECDLGDPSINQVRERIKSTELLAEKCEQEWLEKLSMKWAVLHSTSESAISEGENLAVYLHRLNIPGDVIAATQKVLSPK